MVASALRRVGVQAAAVALLGGLVGCGGGKPAVVEPSEPTTASPAISIPGADGGAPSAPVAVDPRQHEPFEKVAITEIAPESGMLPPPNVTHTGKSTGKINDAVAGVWNQIKFVGTNGQAQGYVAEVEIAGHGTVEIALRHDLAPNHVRNFVALATLEYYDGLRIDRVVRQTSEADDANKLLLLEAGAPTDAAEPEMGHLGYWLKPEFSERAKHEEGTVGACLHETPDSAAVRFYVALSPAQAMDGNFTVFGKVTKGLDVLKAVAGVPVKSSEPGPDQGKPAAPVVIRKVTVRPVAVQ